jgi:hypothetical protein
MTAIAGKTDVVENGMMLLLFNNTAFTDFALASGTAGSLYVSLHTADPTAGDQTTSEIGYTSYTRVAVARSSAGWTVTGSSVSPASIITFPAGTGGSGTATHFGIGSASSGAGLLLYTGALSPTIVCGSDRTPKITTMTITEDQSASGGKADTGKEHWLQALLMAGSDAFNNVGDAIGPIFTGSRYISLHTADPTEEGDQTSSEITYTGYTRVLQFSGLPWDISGGTATLAATGNGLVLGADSMAFPQVTGGSGTATHFGIGTASSGTGILIYAGALSPNIVCGAGVTPRVTDGTTTITEE